MASRRSWVRIPSAPPKIPQNVFFHLYILQSETSSRYYIGQTQNLSSRVAYHNANYSKSLRNRGPWKLVYSEAFATRSEAVRRERQIKSWKDHNMIKRLVSASR
jgi:putative endonuclease